MLFLLSLAAAAPDLSTLAEELEPAVARARGWSFKEPVPKKVQSVEELQQMLAQTEGTSDNTIHMLKLMGLIPPGYDLNAGARQVLSDQIGGFYDPKTRQLVLVDRKLDESGFMTRLLLAHELGHALDDQYFDLQKLMDSAHESDSQDAARSLVEGSATVAMMAWMMRSIQDGTVTMADLSGAMKGPMQFDQKSFDRAPVWMRAELLVPYMAGAAWLIDGHKLTDLMATDLGWLGERVLSAAADPPVSTEQILHPEKYWTHRDPPVVLSVSGLPADAQRDTFGELACMSLVDPKGGFLKRLSFQSVPTLPACIGWGGDQLVLVDETHAVWVTAWDTPADRNEFVKAWKKAPAHLSLGERVEVFGPGYSKAELEALSVKVEASWGGQAWPL